MTKAEDIKKRNLKSQNVVRLFLLLCILVLVNVISSYLFSRIDLTAEKRYTLSGATKKLLKDLPDVVYFKVYLSGEFPPGFKRLENSTKEMLDEMRIYAGENLQYEFINPSENPDPKQRNDLYRQLYTKGLQPTTLQEEEKEKSSEKIIFPGAIVSFGSKELPLQLLKDQMGASPEQALNSSIEALEYELSNTIRKITNHFPTTIAFITGHGELEKKYVMDISNTLKESYEVEWKTIDGKLDALKNYKAIIVAKPGSAFDEKDKFVIDQFIMNGGKAVWLIDHVTGEMDSLSNSAFAIFPAKELNLDDMLFRYGARVNSDLVQDLQAVPVPMIVGYSGGRPKQSLLPWFYFPLVFPESKHPIVNNLNAIRFQFANTIDTISASGIKKTILLTTSKYTRVVAAPAKVSIDIMQKKPDVNMYSQSKKNLAVLLEGRFLSNFTNRIPPLISENKEIGFKETSVPNKMAVISDGDVIRNDYRKANESPMPLGFDRYTGQTYGNKNFILNVIDYLCDDSGLMTIRSKEIKLRLLDKTLLAAQKTFWQIINTGLPLLIIIIFGFVKSYRRRVKYAK